MNKATSNLGQFKGIFVKKLTMLNNHYANYIKTHCLKHTLTFVVVVLFLGTTLLHAQIIDFETTTGYTFSKRTAAQPVPEIIANPFQNTANSSASVLRVVFPIDTPAFGGVNFIFDTPFEIKNGSIIKFKIYRADIGSHRVELQNPATGTNQPRTTIPNTLINQWETIQVVYTNATDFNNYSTIAINLDQGGSRTVEKTFYVDDVEIISPPLNTANFTKIPTSGDNYYRTKALKQSNGSYLLAGGGYTGEIGVYTTSGTRIWNHKVGGFIFALESFDLNNDGNEDLLVGSSDTNLYAYDGTDGTLLWSIDFIAPLHAIAATTNSAGTIRILAGSSNDELKLIASDGSIILSTTFTSHFNEGANFARIIRNIEVGNFTGGTGNEFFVASMINRNAVQKSILSSNNSLTILSNQIVQEGSSRDDNGFNGFAGDLDGDAFTDIVSQHGIGEPGVIPNVMKFYAADLAGDDFYTSKYRMMIPVIGNFHPNPGNEVFAIYGLEYFIYDKDGNVLSSVRGKQGFTDIDVLPSTTGGLDAVVLGSSPNGDDNLYLLQFSDGNEWKDHLSKFTSSAKISAIDATLNNINSLIDNWNGTPVVSSVKLDLPSYSGETVFTDAHSEKYSFNKIKKYVEYRIPGSANGLTSGESTFEAGTENLSVDSRVSNWEYRTQSQILNDLQNNIVSPQLRSWLNVGHGIAPYISKDTYKKILENSNGFVLGAENKEGDSERWDYHLQMIEDSYANGTPFAFYGKNGVWSFELMKSFVDKIKLNDRNLAFVPSGEDSDGVCIELSYAGRIGIWGSGLSQRWGFKVGGDQFNFNRLWDWEYPLHGHTYLRHVLNNTTKGSSMLELFYYDDYSNPASVDYNKGMEIFRKMLDKGIIGVPTKAQLKSISPVVISGDENVDPDVLKAFTTSNARSFTPSAPSDLVSRLDHRWGMAPLHENDLLKKLYNSQQRGLNYLTYSDYGYVTWAQHGVDNELIAQDFYNEVWHTDGAVLKKDGQVKSMAELLTALETQSQTLPFRVKGDAVWNVIQQSETLYHIILIDPGFVNPKDRTVTLETNLTGNWVAYDRLTQQEINPVFAGGISIDVPAGAFRILEIVKEGSLSLTKDELDLYKIYPNPVKDVFNIELPDGSEAHTMIIYDITGKVIQSKILNSQKNSVNLNNVSTGIYFVRLKSKNNLIVKKLIKE